MILFLIEKNLESLFQINSCEKLSEDKIADETQTLFLDQLEIL